MSGDKTDGKSEDSVRQGSEGLKRRDLLLSGSSLVAASALVGGGFATRAQAQQPVRTSPSGKRPNIVIIWGDDIGLTDVSAYSQGLMGFRTPNIDRIAQEGVLFTDYYGEQSCTAGRASFITGQSGLRTGLTKVGLPGATLGLQKEDPTIAELLKPLGYATGQFGKNHLGDRNEFLPTVHGFDEFYGNLYHLNAEEEPELPDYPKDPAFFAKFGPRGVMDCKASAIDDLTVDPRFGKVGKQVIKDTGPLTRERMVLAVVSRPIRRHSSINRTQTCLIAPPPSLRKSAIVLWSGARRPVSHITSTLRPASRSSRRLD